MGVLQHDVNNNVDDINNNIDDSKSESKRTTPPVQFVWHRVLYSLFIYPTIPWALYLAATVASWKTLLWGCFLMYWSLFSVTTGAHRLWAHRSFKAIIPFRALLAVFFSCANENSIYQWVLDHRTHHKNADTDADPTNINRGFWFAQVVWLIMEPHPAVVEARTKIDMSDVLADPVVAFERKYHRVMVWIFCYTIPTVVPWYFWGESLLTAYLICACLRYIVSLQIVGTANSVVHIWGYKPYDKASSSTQLPVNSIIMIGLGECFHNFHHAFPMDYRISEFGGLLNSPTIILDFLACLGVVWDRKTASQTTIDARKLRVLNDHSS